jgi:hypothetical protein
MTRILLLLILLASPWAAASVVLLPGSSPQTTAPNTDFPNRVAVRVIDDATGAPVAGAVLNYFYIRELMTLAGANCTFDLYQYCSISTGADGVATLPAIHAVQAGHFDLTISSTYGTAHADLTIVVALPVAPLWWAGPTQTGWGLSIPQHGQSLFPVLFTYDVVGRPTWSVLEGQWAPAGVATTYGGALHKYRGSPYYAFDPAKVAITDRDVGAISFISNTQAQLGVTPDPSLFSPPPPTNFVRVQPFDFSPDVKQPERGVSDIWWGGPAQSGWGMTIAEAQGNLFLVWFTYDSNGRPTWFAMTEGSWTDANTWKGPVYLTSGSYLIGQGYSAAAYRATKVGDFSVRFNGTTQATFDYAVEGHAGTLQLQRFAY